MTEAEHKQAERVRRWTIYVCPTSHSPYTCHCEDTARNIEGDCLGEQTVEVVALAPVAEALREAADDLDKAANQFASIKASQEAGSDTIIGNNPDIFAAKADRARSLLESLSRTSE